MVLITLFLFLYFFKTRRSIYRMIQFASCLLILLYSIVVMGTMNGFPNECANRSAAGRTRLPKDIIMPSAYKVSAVFTDWLANSTMMIEELRRNNSYAIKKTTRNNRSKWSTLNNHLLYSNFAGCHVMNKSDIFAIPSDISSLLNIATVASLSELVETIVERRILGFNSFVRIVSGIEGVGWLGCLDDTPSSSVVAVEVVYAGKESFHSPSTFNNPLILSLALSHYSNASDVKSNITSRLSLEFSSFQDPIDIDSDLEIPHGQVCNGLAESGIPTEFPYEFDAIFSVQDSASMMHSKLMYNHHRSIIMESVINGRALLLNESFSNDEYLVVHDFARNLEFTFSNSKVSPSCSSRNINASFPNEAIALFIPDFENLNFTLYSNTTELNSSVVEYRSPWEGKVIEVGLRNSKLSTVSIYSNGTLESIRDIALWERDARHGDSFDLESLLRECFSEFSYKPVSFILKEVPMEEFAKWSESVVSIALSESLASIANSTISPYRLSFFYVKDEEGDIVNGNVRVIMKVADGKGPADMTSSQFISLLNATLPSGVKIKLSDTETWSAEGSLIPYSPLPPLVPPSFNGYTGGSMLVMALFMAMMGVGVGAGGVYFVFRRQRISTLAYQVFE